MGQRFNFKGFRGIFKRLSSLELRQRKCDDSDQNKTTGKLCNSAPDVSETHLSRSSTYRILKSFIKVLSSSIADGNSILKDKRVKEAIKEAIILYMAQVPSDELFALVSESLKMQRELSIKTLPSPQGSSTEIDVLPSLRTSKSEIKRPRSLTSPPVLMNNVERKTSDARQPTTSAREKIRFASELGPNRRWSWDLTASENIPEGFSTEYAFKLLQSVFPAKIIPMLKWDMGDSIAEYHKDVSVFFSDLVGFTDWCALNSPTTVIECLSAYFQILDDLAEQWGIYKVETIGDAWMAICGAPKTEPNHSEIMGTFALQVLETLPDLKKIFNCTDISMRIGMHCGPVVSGVVKADRPRWQLFGDTVNMASRMESTGCAGKIQISKDMYRALMRSSSEFICSSRGFSEIKGKGIQETYFLDTRKTASQMSVNRLTLSNVDNNTECTPSTSTGVMGNEKPRNLSVNISTAVNTSAKNHSALLNGTLNRSVTFSGIDPDRKLNVRLKARMTEDRCESESLPTSPTAPMSPLATTTTTTTSGMDQLKVVYKSEEDVKKLAILIVDNNASILMQFQRLLRRSGFKIYTARDGQEALDLMKENLFVVVFMDIHLPGMNGFELVQHFREWETHRRIRKQPIIGLSVSSREAFFMEVREHFGPEFQAFDDYCEKNTNKITILKNITNSLLSW